MSSPVDLAVEARELSEAQNPEDPSSPLATGEWLTQSQFAQVIFMDVADNYPNDCDLICRFSLNDLIEVKNGDRVGIYRVPHISPHEYVAMEWIVPQDDEATAKKDFDIDFKRDKLPKVDDIYQYQYIRGDNSVLGASIPFHLRKPKNEELCAVEDDEEFMVVRSNTSMMSDHYKDRVQELETKYSDLLSLSEKVQEELEVKSQSFIYLDEQYKSLVGEKAKFGQLKEDLAAVLNTKIELENKLHKALTDLDKMTTKMENTITEKDHLLAKLDESHRQQEFLTEEAKQSRQKAEELNNMLKAMTKSKELALDEIKDHILQKDKLEKQISELQSSLDESRLDQFKRNEEKKKILRESEEAEDELKKTIMDKEEEIDQLRRYIEVLEAKTERLELKSLPVDSGSIEEKPDFENLYITGQDRIMNLEKMLKDLQKSLNVSAENHAEEMSQLKNDIEMIRSCNASISDSSSVQNLDSMRIRSAILGISVNSAGDIDKTGTEESYQVLDLSMKDQSGHPITDQPRSSNSFEECNLRELQEWASSGNPASISIGNSEAKETGEEIGSTLNFGLGNSEIESNDAIGNSENDSNEAIGKPFNSDSPNGDSSVARLRVAADELRRWTAENDSNEAIGNPFNSDSPNGDSAVASLRAAADELRRWTAGNSEGAEANPSNPDNETEVANKKNAFVLTDDGRLIEVEDETAAQIAADNSIVKCPICNLIFKDTETMELQVHVEDHLTTSNICPVCDKNFSIAESDEFQQHVQGHFDTEDFSVVTDDDDLFQNPEAVASRNQRNPLYQHLSDQESDQRREERQQSPFDFVGEVANSVASTVTNSANTVASTVTNSVRRWNLDID